ncbi:MAG: divalent-cation tolerance protein CutA [Planctomycetes bacterium]|nr:divalent-cation tolerance protein CutA [Planctomycetota bacterium]
MSAPDAVVLLCTAPASPAAEQKTDQRSAEQLARELLELGLCACVNLVPGVRSLFRWQGAIEAADETLLVLKTTRAAVPALAAALAARHPYQVPELLELPVVWGAPSYLAWLTAAVGPVPPAGAVAPR